MANPNYQNPGIYTTLSPLPTTTNAGPGALSICILANANNNYPTASQTDRFLVTSGVASNFTLTQSGTVMASGLVVTNNTTGVLLVSGTDYSYSQSGGVTTITTITGSTNMKALGTGYIAAKYTYTTAASGQTYSFNSFNAVQAAFGPAFTYSTNSLGYAVATINSPATLGAWFAFQNGASRVLLQNIPTPNSGNETDFLTAVQNLVTIPGIDVIVPLKYDTAFNSGSNSVLFNGINNFLTAQASNGVYQRAFVGLDSTVSNANLISTVNAITSSVAGIATGAGTRMSLAVPQQINVDPGVNSTTGTSTGFVTIDGVYLAAALAGLFVGQSDVYIPITHKNVNGIYSIPNQISGNDSTTIQSLGGTVVRQRTNGTVYVRHGLTLNTTNWLTQEISINAIGDRLANNISSALDVSNIIGSPLTVNSIASLHSTVLTTLQHAVTTSLIQSFQGLSVTLNPNNPTSVNVAFSYSPTYPLNYVQVNLSINTQSGAIVAA